MDQGLNIPIEYQKLTVTQAFTLMGIKKATFYRNYLGEKAKPENRISQQVADDGKKFIAFDELFRVFGQDALKGLRRYMDGPVDTSQEKSNGRIDTPVELHRTPHETTVTIPLEEYIRLKVAAERLPDLEAWKNQAQTLLLSAPRKPWWKRLFSNTSQPPPERETA